MIRSARKMLFTAGAAIFLHGCADDPDRVATSTLICDVKQVAPGRFIRLSQYQGREWGSRTHRVVAVCNDQGGCAARVAYEGPYAPVVTVQANGDLLIEVAGIRHRVLPEDNLTRSTRVHFTSKVGADGEALMRKYGPVDCANPVREIARRKRMSDSGPDVKDR